jgi:hypothetical protein
METSLAKNFDSSPSRVSAFGRRDSGGSSNTEKITIEPQSHAPVRTAPAHPAAAYTHPLDFPVELAKTLPKDQAKAILDLLREVDWRAAHVSHRGIKRVVESVRHKFDKATGRRTDAHKLQDALQWFAKNGSATAIPDPVDRYMHLHHADYKGKKIYLTIDENNNGVTQNIYTFSHRIADTKAFGLTFNELRSRGWRIQYEATGGQKNDGSRQIYVPITKPEATKEALAKRLRKLDEESTQRLISDATFDAAEYVSGYHRKDWRHQRTYKHLNEILLKAERKGQKNVRWSNLYQIIKWKETKHINTALTDLPGLTMRDGVNIMIYRHMFRSLNYALREGSDQDLAEVGPLCNHINASLKKFPDYEGWVLRVLGGVSKANRVNTKDLQKYRDSFESFRDTSKDLITFRENQYLSWATTEKKLRKYNPKNNPANVRINGYILTGHSVGKLSKDEVLQKPENPFVALEFKEKRGLDVDYPMVTMTWIEVPSSWEGDRKMLTDLIKRAKQVKS